MNNPKPDFFTIIKTNISSITKHPMNICPSSKRNTNQGRITFQSNISKSTFELPPKHIYIYIQLDCH